MQKTLHIVDHPLVIDSLTHLRNKKTSLDEFRYHSDKLCQLLFAEALRGLEFTDVEIETPLEKIMSPKFAEQIIVLPVLRAGLAMLFGALQFLPKAKVGFIGLERDDETAIAREYYWKVPTVPLNSTVIITDPMLATGGSCLHLLRHITEKTQVKSLRVVCVIAAPEGIDAVHREFPHVQIFTAAIDSHLNSKKFIVPGLGDYGDRYFGTE